MKLTLLCLAQCLSLRPHLPKPALHLLQTRQIAAPPLRRIPARLRPASPPLRGQEPRARPIMQPARVMQNSRHAQRLTQGVAVVAAAAEAAAKSQELTPPTT